MSELSPSTKALLRAARSDLPDAATRAKIWTAVGGAGAIGGASSGAAGASAAAKATALAGSAKLLVLGALFGSAVTVGVAAFALRLKAPVDDGDAVAMIQRAPIEAPASRAMEIAAPGSMADRESPSTANDRGDRAPSSPESAVHVAPHRAAIDVGAARSHDDALARESALLAEARGALVRGEPESALASIRAARSLPRRSLEPETMAIEARALRAEGHFAEADAVLARLRERFPDNALAR